MLRGYYLLYRFDFPFLTSLTSRWSILHHLSIKQRRVHTHTHTVILRIINTPVGSAIGSNKLIPLRQLSIFHGTVSVT